MWLGFISVFHMMEAWKSFENSTINSRTWWFPLKMSWKWRILCLKIFEFDCKFYQQISGVAIGTKFAPLYACIFMDYIETEFFKTQYNTLVIEKIHWWYLLYLDRFRKNVNKFLKDLNEFHPYLNFTYEKSQEKINFLHLLIKLTDGKIVTDLYCKSTDSHQYLHYDSCDAEHIKRSIVFSKILWLTRICSQKSDLQSWAKCLEQNREIQ